MKTHLKLVNHGMTIEVTSKTGSLETKYSFPVPDSPERVTSISPESLGEEADLSTMVNDGRKYIGKHFTYKDSFCIYRNGNADRGVTVVYIPEFEKGLDI